MRVPRAQHTTEGVKIDEVQAVVAALKQAALNFGETAGALDCNVIHIKGNTHIFSCYDIGSTGNVRMPGLVVCSQLSAQALVRVAMCVSSADIGTSRCGSFSPSTQRCTRHRLSCSTQKSRTQRCSRSSLYWMVCCSNCPRRED